MVTDDFKLARIPEIHFGPGTLRKLSGLASRFGKSALVVTGGWSLKASGMLVGTWQMVNVVRFVS